MTGPVIRKMLNFPSITASILNISAETVYVLGRCLSMINRTTFVNPSKYEKFAKHAFRCLMCDLGNFGFLSGNTHALLCHGRLAIEHAQNDLGVALGDLSENSIEMGNKLNLNFRKIFSRKNNIAKENADIFRRRLMISDPFLIIQGVLQQTIRKGNIYKAAL